MAERYGLLEGVLDLVDETASSWLHETFRLWLVVNLESLDRDRAADVVAEAFRHRFDTRPGSR
jgi:hypothetical protein